MNEAQIRKLRSTFAKGGLVFFPSTRVLWCKLGKCGGTSLLEALPSRLGSPVVRKREPAAYANALLWNDLDGWLPLVVTRNPFDRFLSLFCYAKRSRMAGPMESIDEFVRAFERRYHTDATFRAHARPRSEFDVPGVVGIEFENLEAGVNWFLDFHFDAEPIELPHRNANSTPIDWRQFFTAEERAADFVRDFYHADFGPLYDKGLEA